MPITGKLASYRFVDERNNRGVKFMLSEEAKTTVPGLGYAHAQSTHALNLRVPRGLELLIAAQDGLGGVNCVVTI